MSFLLWQARGFERFAAIVEPFQADDFSVLERPDVLLVDADLDSALAPSRPERHESEHLVSCVDQFMRVV